MARNEFEREVGQMLATIFPFRRRLDDVAFNRDGNRQVSLKAFDYFGCTHSGQFWAAEVKRTVQRRFPMENIREHQRAGLGQLAGYGAHAWLFINWRWSTPRAGLAIWIPYLDYIECEKEWKLFHKSVVPADLNSQWFLRRVAGGWRVPDNHPLRILYE